MRHSWKRSDIKVIILDPGCLLLGCVFSGYGLATRDLSSSSQRIIFCLDEIKSDAIHLYSDIVFKFLLRILLLKQMNELIRMEGNLCCPTANMHQGSKMVREMT